jgi:hypothetical protein
MNHFKKYLFKTGFCKLGKKKLLKIILDSSFVILILKYFRLLLADSGIFCEFLKSKREDISKTVKLYILLHMF